MWTLDQNTPPATGGGTAPVTTSGAILGTLESIFTRGISAYADSQVAKYTGNDPRLYTRDPLTGAAVPQGNSTNLASYLSPGTSGVLVVVVAALGLYLILRK